MINGQALAVSADGSAYVAEAGGRRLIAFPRASAQEATVLAPRRGQEPLFVPIGLALGPDDNLYLLDSGTGDVHVYSQDGTEVRTMKLGSQGALAIALDGDGNIYVADTGAHVVRKFLADGSPDHAWGDRDAPGARRVGPVSGLAVVDGALFAAVSNKLLRFDASGNRVFERRTIGNAGMLAAGPGKTLLVSDLPTHRVWVYSTDGEVMARIGGDGDRTATFNQPRGVAASSDGSQLYAVNDSRVTVYRAQWPFALR
jgi:sugar lactone lactonase YvrE